MARYSSTYSGDMTSFIGGKIASAAGMARDEADAQEKDKQAGLNVANSGNLFIKALGSEFGGDLFARTIGVFNPKQSAAQTDRASSKAKRFAANFPRTEKKEDQDIKKSSREVDRAKDELLRDDDHIPVKDEKLRDYVTRVFGVGIDSKLTQVDARVSKGLGVLSDIRQSHETNINLMVDHNELIASKLDKILELYSEQYQYQKGLKDKAEASRTENELERRKDLSITRRYGALDPMGGMGGMLFGGLTDNLVKRLVKRLLDKARKSKLLTKSQASLLETILTKSSTRAATGATATAVLRKARKDLALEFATELAAERARTKAIGESFSAVTRSSGALDSLALKPKKAVKTTAQNALRKLSIKELTPFLTKDFLEMFPGSTPLDMLQSMEGFLKMGGDFGGGSAGADTVIRPFKESAVAMTQSSNPKIADAGRALINEIQQFAPGAISLDDLVMGADALRVSKPATEVLGAGTPKMAKALSGSVAQTAGKKIATKTGAKALAKTGKFVPGVGTMIALGEAGYRLGAGDTTGAILSLLSAIPILGWGVTALDIGRDFGFNPLGLPPPPDQTISADQSNLGGYYEAGTSMLTEPGVKVLHGDEKVLGVDPGTGMTTDHIQNIGDSIVSASAKMAQDLAVSRDVANSISSLPFTVKRVNYSSGIKTGPVKSRSDTQSIFDVQSDISQFKKEAETAVEDPREEKANEALDREEKQNSRWFTDPRRHLNFGNGGNSSILSNSPLLAQQGDTTIQFHGKQGRDLSGEPGVDFSYGDYRNNYSLFDGTVIETGLLYGKNYGNVVVVRSTDPSCGKQFDALYAHFPDGGIYVKPGDRVTGGAILGKVGFVSVSKPGVPELQPNNAGNMSGWHTSVDFFEPDSATRYANADKIINLILSSNGLKPNNLLQKLAITQVEAIVPNSTDSIVEYYTGDQSHPNWEPYLHDGGNEHEHYGFSSKEERDRAMAILRQHGLIVDPGGEPGDHTEGSLHYEDRALDVQFGPHMIRDEHPWKLWIKQLIGQSGDIQWEDSPAGEEAFAEYVRQILIDNNFTGITQDEVGPEYFQEHGTIDSERFNDLSDPFLNKNQKLWEIPDYLHKRNLELQNNSMLLDEMETEAANKFQIVLLNNTVVNHNDTVKREFLIGRGFNMDSFRMAKLAG
tara:strand:+ start:147 stop:3599 length:3453 start_codon:yes stop_codon:yes gene_type:complete